MDIFSLLIPSNAVFPKGYSIDLLSKDKWIDNIL